MPHSAKSLAAVLASALLGLSVVTATAFALTIKGTRGDDHIQGSNNADRIIARAGNTGDEPVRRGVGGVRAAAARCGLVRTGATGLEPATSGVTGRRSNRLSYAPSEHR